MRKLRTKLEGTYINRKGRKFRVEISTENTKELYNFYGENMMQKEEVREEVLLCSVYIESTMRTGLSSNRTGTIQESYGDYSIYSEYKDFLNLAKTYPEKDLDITKKTNISDPVNRMYLTVFEKRNARFLHKYSSHENNIINERIELYTADGGAPISFLDLEMTSTGKKVRANRMRGIKYVERESLATEAQTVLIQPLEYIAKEKNIKWIFERDYRIINTKEEFEAYCERMKKERMLVGFDTETTGLRINRLPVGHAQRDLLVGICLSVENGEGVYIPIRQTKFNNLDETYVMDTLRPILSNSKDPETGKKTRAYCDVVTHYGSFDWKVMYTYDWDLNITEDTYLLQYLIDVRQANAVKKLKVMSEKILGLQMIDLQDFFPSLRGGSKSEIKFSLLPYDSVRVYGPVDSGITRELFFKLRPLLPDDMQFIYGVEVQLMKRLSRIEYYGIRLDITKLREHGAKVEIEKNALEEEIYQLAGEQFNINSGDRLASIMYTKLNYPIHGYTSSGKPATGKKVMKILDSQKDLKGNALYPLAGKILDYKNKEKLLNSFLHKLVRENVDGYVFPKYNQAGAESGRISCNNPNLQQTSGAIREAFVPDSDDYYFLVCDYSQVEYRVMSGLADEFEVIDFFSKNPEADYHIMMYARMTGKKYEEVTSKERKQGKTLNFGISYGMGPESLAIALHGASTSEYVEDAKQKIRDYFDSVANIRDYLTDVRAKGRKEHFVRTLFNRRRYISEYMKENPSHAELERGHRKAGNTVVQGTAADIMKYAHVRVENAIEKRGIDMRVVASIHDELVMLVNKKYNPWQIISMVRDAMEIDLSRFNFPPLYIGANVGNSWSDGKVDNLECPVKLMELRKKECEEGLHTEAYSDPKSMVSDQLTLFAIQQVYDEIQEGNIQTLEEAHSRPRLMKYLGNYIGADEHEFIVQGLLSGETPEKMCAQSKRIEVLGEDYYENILNDLKSLDADDSDIFDEEMMDGDDYDDTIIDYEKLRAHYDSQRNNLKQSDFMITNRKRKMTDYAIQGYNKKLYINIAKPTKGMLEELNHYLKSVEVPKGYEVLLMANGNFVPLNMHISRIDRISLISIIEKHLMAAEAKKIS